MSSVSRASGRRDLFGRVGEKAQRLRAAREADQHDANVLDHREQHLAERLRLRPLVFSLGRGEPARDDPQRFSFATPPTSAATVASNRVGELLDPRPAGTRAPRTEARRRAWPRPAGAAPDLPPARTRARAPARRSEAACPRRAARRTPRARSTNARSVASSPASAGSSADGPRTARRQRAGRVGDHGEEGCGRRQYVTGRATRRPS